MGTALPVGAGPDAGALKGEDFSWVVGAAGVFCCRGIERGQGIPKACNDSFSSVRTQNQGPVSVSSTGWPQTHYVAEAGFELLSRAEIPGMSHRAWLILSTIHIYSLATTYSLQWLCTGRLLCTHAVDERTKAQGAEWSAHSPTAKKGQAYAVGLPHSYLGLLSHPTSALTLAPF